MHWVPKDTSSAEWRRSLQSFVDCYNFLLIATIDEGWHDEPCQTCHTCQSPCFPTQRLSKMFEPYRSMAKTTKWIWNQKNIGNLFLMHDLHPQIWRDWSIHFLEENVHHSDTTPGGLVFNENPEFQAADFNQRNLKTHMATWHKIQINLHGLHVFGESIKIIEIQGTTFEIFGSFKNPKKTVPPFFSSLFFSRFTVIPTLRSANFGQKKCLGDASDGRDAPLGDVELFVEAQKLLIDAFRLLLGRVHVPFGEIRKGPNLKHRKKDK